jgi:hypothetical protein
MAATPPQARWAGGRTSAKGSGVNGTSADALVSLRIPEAVVALVATLPVAHGTWARLPLVRQEPAPAFPPSPPPHAVWPWRSSTSPRPRHPGR